MSKMFDQLQRAKDIVDRFNQRGGIFPREYRDCGRNDPVRQQEYRDACKVKTWKYSLRGKNRYSCSDEVRDYLDQNMPGWRDENSRQCRSFSSQMRKAREIVRRYRERGCVRPRRFNDPSRQQEYKDAVLLGTWKSALKGQSRASCSDALRDYLDINIPGWREDHRRSRRHEKEIWFGRAMTDEKVHSGKIHTNKKLTPEVLVYLDAKMPGWNKENNRGTKRNRSTEEYFCHTRECQFHEAFVQAREIVQRCSSRVERGLHCLPRHLTGREERLELSQERIDARKLSSWKRELQSMGESGLRDNIVLDLKSYLDKELPEWITIDCVSPETYSISATHLPDSSDIKGLVDSTATSNSALFLPVQDMADSPSQSHRMNCNQNAFTNFWSGVTSKDKNKFVKEQDGISALLQLRYSETPPKTSLVSAGSNASSSNSPSLDGCGSIDKNLSSLSEQSGTQHNISPTTTTGSSVSGDSEDEIARSKGKGDTVHNLVSVRKDDNSPTTSVEVPNNDSDNDSMKSESCDKEHKLRDVTPCSTEGFKGHQVAHASPTVETVSNQHHMVI